MVDGVCFVNVCSSSLLLLVCRESSAILLRHFLGILYFILLLQKNCLGRPADNSGVARTELILRTPRQIFPNFASKTKATLKE